MITRPIVMFLLNMTLGVLSQMNVNENHSRATQSEVHSSPIKRDVRVRKEFTSMSLMERRRFIQAYKIVSTVAPFRQKYEHLVEVHSKLFLTIHRDKQFFPWHRWYLFEFENLLRQVDKRITLPYWDWSIQSQNPWSNGTRDLWNDHPWGLGGNGSDPFACVESGPFKKTSWRLANQSGKGCLRRKFMDARLPGVVAIHSTLRLTPKNFRQFEEEIRTFFHNELHCCIQGTMELPSASNTPEFILHHSFIDKLWHDWQLKYPDHKFTLRDKMTTKLLGSPYKVEQFMDSHNLLRGTAVYFRDPFIGYKKFHRTLSSLPNKLLLLIDSYNSTAKKTCCPVSVEDFDAKGKDLFNVLQSIQVEVQVDYGKNKKKHVH